MERVFWGNTLENWIIFAIIILSTIVLARLISYLIKKILRPYAEKSKTSIDDIILDSIESPLLFGIMLIGIWVAVHRLDYPDTYVRILNNSYRILIVLTFTWLISRFCNSFLINYSMNRHDRSQQAQKFSGKMMPIIKRTLLIAIWLIGIVTALSNINIDITALLGTLGIGGIAFALAAQDTVKNVFGAFTILSDRPFTIGDTIKVDSYEGTIIDVGMRSTKMRNYDKRIITFPNYKIADAYIVNISMEPMRRVVVKIGLTYDTTPEKMQEALDILRDMPKRVEFVSVKDVVANFSEFADSALVITFIYFIEKKGNNGKVTSNVNMEILTAFNKAGLKFAYPTQTLFIEKDTEPTQPIDEKSQIPAADK